MVYVMVTWKNDTICTAHREHGEAACGHREMARVGGALATLSPPADSPNYGHTLADLCHMVEKKPDLAQANYFTDGNTEAQRGKSRSRAHRW